MNYPVEIQVTPTKGRKPATSKGLRVQRLVRLLFLYEIKVRITCVIWFVGLLIIGSNSNGNMTKWICFVLAVPPMTLAQLDSEIWRLVFRLPNPQGERRA